MSPEFLSRLQFALTASFHFIFPPISIGLGVLLVWMGWRYLRTGDPVWRQSSFFRVRVYGLVFALGIATGIVRIPQSYRAHAWLLVLPAAAAVAVVVAGVSRLRRRGAAGFFSSAGAIVVLLASLAAGLYPNLLTSSIDARYSMTVSNASSAAETLMVMPVVAAIGLPFVFLYTAGVQYLFRGKVRLTDESY